MKIKWVQIACLSGLLASGAAVNERPNLLLILADDLGWGDVGFNGCGDISTPALDSLAASGVRCTAAYASHGYCGPSRAGLMTGRWQQRFGNVINPPFAPAHDNVGLARGEKTLAEYLQDAGYTTGLVGKWHLGAAEPMHPMSRGFDSFFGFLGGGRDYFPEDFPPQDKVWSNLNDVWYFYKLPLHRGRQPIPPPQGYLTDILTEEAVRFVSRKRDEPFFLFLSYNAPHTPLSAKEEDLAKYSHIEDEQRRTYAAMIDCMDQGVGRVMKALNENGLHDNTLVIFASDNGGRLPWSNNGPFSGGKGAAYEGGFRVPCILRWPGRLEAGQDFVRPLSLLDIMPTLMHLAGIEADPDRPLDGVNLLPFLNGEQTGDPHERIYAKRYYNTNPDVGNRAMRQGDWKLVQNKFDGPFALFNLGTDPGEKNDLRSVFPEKMAQMERDYRKWESMHVPPPWGWSEEGANGMDVRKIDISAARRAFEGSKQAE